MQYNTSPIYIIHHNARRGNAIDQENSIQLQIAKADLEILQVNDFSRKKKKKKKKKDNF